MAGAHIEPDFSGQASLLQDGRFSDVTVELADGQKILAHRAILAAASDVLSAKFAAPTRDAAERVWRPEAGSAPAWQWIMGWTYGKREPLPWGLLVEIFVLADYLQLNALVDSIANLDLQGNFRNVAQQLLEVKDCPPSLDKLAAKCVPAVTLDLELWNKLLQASLHIVRLFVKFLELHPLLKIRASSDEPLRLIEECGLVLLGARLRAEDGVAFPDCFVDAIRWDAFPANALKQAIIGDVAHFKPFLNSTWVTVSANVKEYIVLALAARCERFERREQRDVSPATTQHGLFSRMRENRLEIEVLLSSQHPNCPGDPVPVLMSRGQRTFGTANQSSSNQPWIELKAKDAMVHPRAVGLCHGAGPGFGVCDSFVIEAAVGDGVWKELLNASNTPLSSTCNLHVLPSLQGAPGVPHHELFFNRFRLRMTGRNSIGNWRLFVSWFDVFGIPASREVLETLAAAAASFPQDQPEGLAGPEGAAGCGRRSRSRSRGRASDRRRSRSRKRSRSRSRSRGRANHGVSDLAQQVHGRSAT